MELQQGQTQKNFEHYWIWHSEKTKTTCEQCKKHDGKKFYKKEDIPKLPVHPNCKCYVEEVVKEIPSPNINNYKNTAGGQCDCLKKARELRNKIENLIVSTDEFYNETSAKYIDLFQLEESIQSMIDRLSSEYDFWKNEIGKHQPSCFKDPNLICARIHENKIDTEKMKTKFLSDCSSTSFSNFINNVKNFQKGLRNNLLIDINVLIDNIENDFSHSKNECRFMYTLSQLTLRTGQASSESNQFKIKFKTFVDEEKKYQNLLRMTEALVDLILMDKYEPCDCKQDDKIRKTPMEEVTNVLAYLGYAMTIAGSNLRDSRSGFAAARANEHTVVVNRKLATLYDEKIDEYLNQSKIAKDEVGVIYDEGSKQSKALFDTNAISDFIANNKEDLKNGKFKDSYVPIEFEFKRDPDAYLGIQHCRIYDPHIDENGYFNAVLVDYYDFDRREINSYKSSFAPLNNWGYAMQEKGYLKNYFVVYYIKEKVE